MPKSYIICHGSASQDTILTAWHLSSDDCTRDDSLCKALEMLAKQLALANASAKRPNRLMYAHYAAKVAFRIHRMHEYRTLFLVGHGCSWLKVCYCY
jgi:hypothetical protein